MSRFIGLLGLVLILGVAWLCSAHKRSVKLNLIAWGLGLQLAFAILVLKTNFGKVFQAIGQGVNAMLGYVEVGTEFLFGPLGTPGIGATIKYVNGKKVPHLFVVSGATKFANFGEFPMTTTGLPSYTTEGLIYARYIAKVRPSAKIAILYQNDDLGRDFVNAFKVHFKDDFDKKVVVSPYEVSEPTIDSHVVSLKSSGADAFLFAGTPKFAAQSIKKADEIGWKPLFLINVVSTSVASTITPAGPEKAVGIVAATMFKDPGDSKWADDAGMKWYREHFAKYLPGADIGDANYLYGTQQGQILEQVLKQCGNELSRENVLKQARNIRGLSLPTLIPGITINTGPDNSMAYTQLQLQRWTGSSWEQFGEVLSAEAK